ncbi:MAG TPA: asparaginase [Azoarcus taiwanensis]|nr:asparaginase [Azoarcus taiwanensis]
MSQLPCIALLATGGTIAGAAASAAQTSGYNIGGVDAHALLNAVPQLAEVARVMPEQLINIDSKDMTPAHWLQIAASVRQLLAQPGVDGVVITHGTDTLEETATALDLLLPVGKPVVMTCAMRPSTALSADGPMNLYDAVRCAASTDAADRGVMLCFGERILPALGLRKLDAHRLAAFDTTAADLGTTRPAIRFFAPAPARQFDTLELPEALGKLPPVEIVYCAAGTPPDLIQAAMAAGAQGIVAVLPGNGSVPDAWIDALAAAVAQGLVVVRGSRCGQGAVFDAGVDARIGSLPAGLLSPGAARAAVMLALEVARSDEDFVPESFLRSIG